MKLADVVYANNFPSVRIDSCWLHEHDAEIWHVADMTPHDDGNASIVLVRMGPRPARKAVTAHWLINNPQFTLVDRATAEQFMRLAVAPGGTGGDVGGGIAARLARLPHRVLGWLRGR